VGAHREEWIVSAEDEVRAASERFYRALNAMANGDASAMDAVWSHGGSVTAMHPIGGREVGWDQVRPVWGQVASVASGGQIDLADQLVSVAQDMAYEVGIERGHAIMAGEDIAIEHRVTNVYRHEGGTWNMIHHHTDLSPAMVDLLARLQAKAQPELR
jgi:ketosteroid isomerase-like protein